MGAVTSGAGRGVTGHWSLSGMSRVHNKTAPKTAKLLKNCVGYGGDDGARTRDLRRDRPAF